MALSEKAWRRAFFASLACLLCMTGLAGYLALSSIDNAVRLSYLADDHDQTVRDLKDLAQIFPRGELSKTDIVWMLRQDNPDALIVENRCWVQLNGLRFEFTKAGMLAKVEPRAMYVPAPDCGST